MLLSVVRVGEKDHDRCDHSTASSKSFRGWFDSHSASCPCECSGLLVATLDSSTLLWDGLLPSCDRVMTSDPLNLVEKIARSSSSRSVRMVPARFRFQEHSQVRSQVAPQIPSRKRHGHQKVCGQSCENLCPELSQRLQTSIECGDQGKDTEGG